MKTYQLQEIVDDVGKFIQPSFNKSNTELIIDYLINIHHEYVRTYSVIIYDLIQEVAFKHAEKHPELEKVNAALFLFLNDLLNLLKKKEQILFPIIRKLIDKRNRGQLKSNSTPYFIKDAVIELQNENLGTCKNLKLLRKLTNEYLVPSDACYLYSYLYLKMKEFENNLRYHIHIENTLLTPRAKVANGEAIFKNARRISYEKRTV